ncbi:sarcosine oxidase subunit gamma [Rhodobacteraceae bacterium M382]|nr:sarcosine oxidase subunit gamma [Rhodobacteraceae bacterium M382]
MGYDVTFQRQKISALFDLKGKAEGVADWAGAHLPAFPEQPNTFTDKGGMALCYIGRDHWILRAEIGSEEALLEALKPEDAPPDLSIVRVSDTMTFFQVTGPDAAQIMAIASPLDLHPAVFSDHAVTFTEVFHLKALVRRIEDGFEFAIEQSFANLVEDYLSRATA